MKTKILIAGLVIAIVLISGCTQTKEPAPSRTTTTSYAGLLTESKSTTTTVKQTTITISTTRKKTTTTIKSTLKKLQECDRQTDIDDKYKCYYDIAVKEGDKTICNKIKHPPWKSICLAGVTKKPEFCDDIKISTYRYNCYYNMAKIHDDFSYCRYITEPYERYYNFFLGKNQCLSDCLEEFKDRIDDIGFCERLGDPLDRDKCIIRIATLRKDLSICKEFVWYSDRGKCYVEVGLKKDRVHEVCEKEYRAYYVSCVRSFALEFKDATLCNLIRAGDDRREDCYYDLAIAKKDPSICEKASKERGWMDSCYYKIAIAKKDISICEKIDNENLLNKCYQKVLA